MASCESCDRFSCMKLMLCSACSMAWYCLTACATYCVFVCWCVLLYTCLFHHAALAARVVGCVEHLPKLPLWVFWVDVARVLVKFHVWKHSHGYSLNILHVDHTFCAVHVCHVQGLLCRWAGDRQLVRSARAMHFVYLPKR